MYSVNIYNDYTVHMILKHLLYLYFVARKALLYNLLVILLDTILMIYSYICYSLIFDYFSYYSLGFYVFICVNPYLIYFFSRQEPQIN